MSTITLTELLGSPVIEASGAHCGRVREVALSQPDRFVIGGPRGHVEEEEVNPRHDEHNDQDPSNQGERRGPANSRPVISLCPNG